MSKRYRLNCKQCRPWSEQSDLHLYCLLRPVCLKTLDRYAMLLRSLESYRHMNCLMTKPTKQHECPAKTQISLGICPDWSGSSLCAQCVAKDPSFLHAGSEDSDQTGRMPRLFWVFAGRLVILLVLSWGSSIILSTQVSSSSSAVSRPLISSGYQDLFCLLLRYNSILSSST